MLMTAIFFSEMNSLRRIYLFRECFLIGLYCESCRWFRRYNCRMAHQCHFFYMRMCVVYFGDVIQKYRFAFMVWNKFYAGIPVLTQEEIDGLADVCLVLKCARVLPRLRCQAEPPTYLWRVRRAKTTTFPRFHSHPASSTSAGIQVVKVAPPIRERPPNSKSASVRAHYEKKTMR